MAILASFCAIAQKWGPSPTMPVTTKLLLPAAGLRSSFIASSFAGVERNRLSGICGVEAVTVRVPGVSSDVEHRPSVKRNQRRRAAANAVPAVAAPSPKARPMSKHDDPVDRATIHADGRLTLRALSAADEPELRRIHGTPEVAQWWDLPGQGFPMTDEPEATRLTMLVDGALAGLIQYTEELEPKYRHAQIDLFLDPRLHSQGFGTEAVRRVVRHLTENRGHHRITIDPAVANAAAIRAYEKAGFRPVGTMREAERDADGNGWHDSLLMELLANDRTSATPD
jgi:aminoglycoside 6'-N-acetyltransferase